ncbi:MAG: NAD(P)/FAD-dependent oxidoreductase [Clostridiales Family XIII bacterium]|uniref:NAD(P)/FAD-dependent oxidoreductase n=1 Tax=Hominibacterium faecale TaxID=2839743 RepID=UPI001D0FED17|nr:NAD(P)/FAD-dependent oxidoreductase [Hominibacterium faecale]MCC2865770.1 NAD(P)/FAD-dependent oxidoreductase [Anaerovorax odorimutans]MCI7302264.1 NAD(P)/FAD-dependent oxidoreductase [Clostridia bacterium]MDE8734544.1 NAD(P)/FAD-dependent oxidoreductase [Eubacteriales bacterium DFI.9.88]MDY3009728.1 NAD(P)/FAD-dependent oxidoreductase [Clostridiales Family XIII bacterium]
MKNYDIIIVGAGASGVFLSYELTKRDNKANVLMIDKGAPLEKRQCPIKKGAKSCLKCTPCHIMNGYGGAGTLSDGKYNITTQFGGDLHNYVGTQEALELMEYVDDVLCSMGGADAKLYSTASSELKTTALRNNLHLLQAKVRHLGTDRNVKILGRVFDYCSSKVDTMFYTTIQDVVKKDDGTFEITTDGGEVMSCKDLVLATGRSGSKWISSICDKMGIGQKRNRVDIGVRVELPAEVFKHITDDVYESKIVYKTDKYNDLVRTFCMNPYGEVVAENTNGIVTVNGHSYADPALRTENTNFALLVSNKFTEPFKDSNEYGESIARLSNMLGGGVLLQRFGDLIKGRRSSTRRMEKCFTRPTLQATPGDLSLVIPKRQLDNIIEMIYALDKIAPGTANEDTLLYGVEVKFYNSKVEVDENLETKVRGMYALGDGSGVTHSLSQASASGVHVGRLLAEKYK